MLYMSFSDMIDRWILDFVSKWQRYLARNNRRCKGELLQLAECVIGLGYPIETYGIFQKG